MVEISGSSSAAASNYNVRSELATNAVKDANEQERQIADRLQEAQETKQEDRRETRQIPGLGNAVDITA